MEISQFANESLKQKQANCQKGEKIDLSFLEQ